MILSNHLKNLTSQFSQNCENNQFPNTGKDREQGPYRNEGIAQARAEHGTLIPQTTPFLVRCPPNTVENFQWFFLGSPMDVALMGARSHNPALWRWTLSQSVKRLNEQTNLPTSDKVEDVKGKWKCQICGVNLTCSCISRVCLREICQHQRALHSC